MWKLMCPLLILAACCSAGPLAQQRKNMPIMAREEQQESSDMQAESEMQVAGTAEATPLVGTLTLPSNATSIRADITDNFSCANKSYGYYADVENDCQIFHVCLPVTYADGKENTFRWSFICPEETIFSQESFTCMRREDMTIECEDSYRYYELNSNFGLPAEEEKESGSNKPAATAAAENEQPDQQQTQSELSEAVAVAEPAPEPVMEPAKPIKVQKPKPKPIRRKPAVTYNKPPRKAPVAATAAPVLAEPADEPEPEVVAMPFAQQASKPLKPQRFNVRPNKEKPQAVKPAIPAAPAATATPMRNELFNSMRKRPAIFNKRPVQESEPTAVTETIVQAELSEPQPTLKLQTMFVEPAKPEEPIAEASEPEPVLVLAQPEADKEMAAAAEPEAEPEAKPEAEPELEAEQTKAEEPMEQLAAEKVDEVKPIEAIQEIPAVIFETLEEKPQEQPAEQLVEKVAAAAEEEQKLETAPLEPAIVESSGSNEEALNNIEALEAARPVDAPVSLPATPEMSQPSPLVEQMLDTTSGVNSEAQESLGGFKPVDPVMAAEAEQLITDFLNTLRKHEQKTETELANAAMDMAETVEQQSQSQQSEAPKPAPTEEESQPAEAEAVSIEEAKLPEPEIVDNNASVEEQLVETEPQLKLKADSPIINIMQLNHLPADYQIPVQVVAAPEPAPESQSKPEPESEPVPEAMETEVAKETQETQAAAAAEPVQDDAQESLATAAYMPSISIDDIVELVKERLDQNPKNEQMTPMELVLTPGAAAPMTLIQSTDGAKPEPVEELAAEPAPVAAAEEEDLILPIYKRVAAADPAMSVAQTAPVTVSKVEAEATPEQELEAAAKSQSQSPSQSPSQLRMDARKRRFLFRADAS